MAKEPKENEQEQAAEVEGEEQAQPKGSKKLLIAAVVLSLISLGGGFFLARMAFQEDAETYAPDYVEEVIEDAPVDEDLIASSEDGKNADGGGEGEEEGGEA